MSWSNKQQIKQNVYTVTYHIYVKYENDKHNGYWNIEKVKFEVLLLGIVRNKQNGCYGYYRKYEIKTTTLHFITIQTTTPPTTPPPTRTAKTTQQHNNNNNTKQQQKQHYNHNNNTTTATTTPPPQQHLYHHNNNTTTTTTPPQQHHYHHNNNTTTTTTTPPQQQHYHHNNNTTTAPPQQQHHHNNTTTITTTPPQQQHHNNNNTTTTTTTPLQQQHHNSNNNITTTTTTPPPQQQESIGWTCQSWVIHPYLHHTVAIILSWIFSPPPLINQPKLNWYEGQSQQYQSNCFSIESHWCDSEPEVIQNQIIINTSEPRNKWQYFKNSETRKHYVIFTETLLADLNSSVCPSVRTPAHPFG